MEVLIGSETKLYCIDGATGNPEWIYQHPNVDFHTSGSLVDVDGDGKLEFLVPNANNDTLRCLNAENGTLLWEKALAYDIHSPFVGDIDGDECVEIVVGTNGYDANGYRIFALDDPYNATDCGALSLGEKSPSISPTLKPYPHGLYLFLPRASQVELLLYDAAGRLVRTLYKGLLPQGGHAFPIKGLRKGVYTALLRSQGRVERVKVVR